MDRSTVALFLFVSLALYVVCIGLGLNALPVLAFHVRVQPLSITGVACGAILIAVAYLLIRGFYGLVLSVKWVAHNWRYSQREDLARRGLLVGWLSAFSLPKGKRPKGQGFEHGELYTILIVMGAALGYAHTAGICPQMVEPGESCLADLAMLFLGPFAAMFFSYIFKWGPQPGLRNRMVKP